ncbi:MAG TPA: helix-turn-helix transcriptional regulator [Symbiobacteriaceae bacterium]|nr:helix-turn-helix transcriptional regulator [Symbiobacteriaceae bacterium]
MAEKWHQLIHLRKAAGLSQYELAKQLKMSRSALGNYEMGEREPDFETTRKLADYFRVSVDFLLGRDGAGDAQDAELEIPSEWLHMIAQARKSGHSPEQVLQALKLLDSLKKQGKSEKEEREG